MAGTRKTARMAGSNHRQRPSRWTTTAAATGHAAAGGAAAGTAATESSGGDGSAQSVSSGTKPASHRNVYTYHLGLLFLLQLLVQLAQRRGPLVMRIARPNDRAASDACWTTRQVAGRLVQVQVQPRPTTTGHGGPVGAGRAARGLAREVGRSGHAAAVGSRRGGIGLGEGIEVGGHGEVEDAGLVVMVVVVVVMVRQGRVDDASTP